VVSNVRNVKKNLHIKSGEIKNKRGI